MKATCRILLARQSERHEKKGNLVYICTGRSEAEVYDYIWEIGLDGMIGGNGSYVKDGDEVLLDQHISAEDERKIVDWLQARNLESNNGLFASEHFDDENGNRVIREYALKKVPFGDH